MRFGWYFTKYSPFVGSREPKFQIKKREETKMIRQISRRNTCRESCRLFADEDRAELKRAKRTNTEGYVNCGGFLEAVSHTFGSWPMGEFVDATRMHILATHNHRGSSRWPWAKRTRSLKASVITIIGEKAASAQDKRYREK